MELAYIAGVIDSDGTIGVAKSDYRARVLGDCVGFTYQARIAVRQVQPQAVDLLFDLYDGYRTISKAYAERGKPLQHWSVTSRQAGVVCEALLPYLRIKRLQAENAIDVCRLAARQSKSFPIPAIVPGEPMVTMAEAARRLGKSYDVVHQAVRKGTGSVPFVRLGPRKVLIPESFLPIWASRPRSPARSAEVSDALEACYLRAKELNQAGI